MSVYLVSVVVTGAEKNDQMKLEVEGTVEDVRNAARTLMAYYEALKESRP